MIGPKKLAMMLGLLLTAPAGVGATAPSPAATPAPPPANESQKLELSGHLGLGFLEAKASERVYRSGDNKLSELTWMTDSVPMLNGGFSATMLGRLKINGDLSVKLGRGSGYLDDYDWLNPDTSAWTDWSHSGHVELDKGVVADISAELIAYRSQEVKVSGLLGLKWENWRWQDYGRGQFIYTHAGTIEGFIPDGLLGITYEQWWTVPYIGIAFTATLQNWELGGRLIASPLVTGKDEDQHHLRDLLFEADFDRTSMWALDIHAAYFITPHWGVKGLLAHERFEEARGTATLTDLVTGDRFVSQEDAFGAELSHTSIMLSVVYRF